MIPSETDQVMMSVTTPDAVKMAEIHAMRQLADSVAQQSRQFSEHMGAQTRALEKMTGKVDDVRERVIRLESAQHGAEIEKVRVELVKALSRIDTLESQRDQMKGAGTLATWLTKNAPWLLAGIAAFAAGMGFKIK